MIANWDELSGERLEKGHMCGTWTDLVILEGQGTLELWPSPIDQENGREREEHPIRAGHVISRPASSGISHHFRAGPGGMTFLAYAPREPNDVCYYPRSNKIFWRGLGLIARLEPLSYDDGEPEE